MSTVSPATTTNGGDRVQQLKTEPPVAATEDGAGGKRKWDGSGPNHTAKAVKTESLQPGGSGPNHQAKAVKKESLQPEGAAAVGIRDRFPPNEFLVLQFAFQEGISRLKLPIKLDKDYLPDIQTVIKRALSTHSGIHASNMRLLYDGEALLAKTPAELVNKDDVQYLDEIDVMVKQTGGAV